MPVIVLLAAILAFDAVPVGAQPLVLDADTAATLALERNLSIQVRQLDLGARERARSSRWNLFAPAVEARVSLDQSYPEAPGLGVGLQARLGLSTAAGYRMRDAVLAYQAGFLDLQTARRQLERDVRISFYSLILSRRRTELAEQSIETSQRRLDAARQNYQLGRISELDLLNVQVALENLRPVLAQARHDYQIEEMRLKDFLGLDPARELTLAGSLEPGEARLDPDQAALLRLAAGSPPILALQRQRLLLENQRRLAISESFVPVLSLSYSYAPALSWSAQSFGLGLAVPLDPWLPRSPGRLRVMEIEDSLSGLELELAAARRQVEIQVRSLALGLSKSLTGMEVGQKNVELAGRAYMLAEREYQLGLVDLLTVLEAYDRLQETQLARLAESYSYQVDLLNLAFVLNTAPDRLRSEREE